ncbi:hypothetical protein [Corynebacterium renale]|uniref:hypothetical protein n=1 Tax=Corynebacterium renale TaxID=1724 RepID=UPI001F29F046|nr:hypothetical protein [Corynebacterium renale]
MAAVQAQARAGFHFAAVDGDGPGRAEGVVAVGGDDPVQVPGARQQVLQDDVARPFDLDDAPQRADLGDPDPLGERDPPRRHVAGDAAPQVGGGISHEDGGVVGGCDAYRRPRLHLYPLARTGAGGWPPRGVGVAVGERIQRLAWVGPAEAGGVCRGAAGAHVAAGFGDGDGVGVAGVVGHPVGHVRALRRVGQRRGRVAGAVVARHEQRRVRGDVRRLAGAGQAHVFGPGDGAHEGDGFLAAGDGRVVARPRRARARVDDHHVHLPKPVHVPQFVQAFPLLIGGVLAQDQDPEPGRGQRGGLALWW